MPEASSMWRCTSCGQSCAEWQAHTLPNYYTCPSCGAKFYVAGERPLTPEEIADGVSEIVKPEDP